MFVPKGPIYNNPVLVQIMAWCRISAIIWTNADPIHWRIYAAPGGDELTNMDWINFNISIDM